MVPYHYFPGKIPLILSIPHTGTYVPDVILERFTTTAKLLPDTDWHLQKLYDFVIESGVHMLVATHSRYVIDLNRGLGGASLYPGQFTTALCPSTLFDGSPIYQQGLEPDEAEILARINTYWQPYHQKLQAIISALKGHERIIIFDAHSIKSEVPLLFDGILPSLNLGTADGVSADEKLIQSLVDFCKNTNYSVVCNGRFKGGYITRQYGNPLQGINAIQLELAQSNYMQEIYPFTYDKNKATQLQLVLQGMLSLIKSYV